MNSFKSWSVRVLVYDKSKCLLLPLSVRINVQNLLITFKALNGQATHVNSLRATTQS